jgi:hypothetical protein
MLARLTKCIAVVAVLLASCLPAHAQDKRSSAIAGINTVYAPVPTPLLQGKRAFIAYELGDVTSFPASYSGGPERAYGEFYQGMKTWGHYELVLDPKDADLVFAVRFVDTYGGTPQIRIGITDAKTHTPLWGFVEQLDFAFRKKNRDLAFTDSVKLLITDIQTLVDPGSIPPPPTPPAPKPWPKRR